MACLSAEQNKVKSTREHLVVRAMTMAKVDRLTDVVLLPTELDTLFFTPCMDRYDYSLIDLRHNVFPFHTM